MDVYCETIVEIANVRQRARGQASAEFQRVDQRSEARRVFETGGLRLRFPNAGAECEAVLINTGGGMTGGDRAQIEMSAGAGAEAIVVTQAAEKIYRAGEGATEVQVRLAAEPGASLVWAPQETLLFDHSNLRRRLEADVAADASLMIVESMVFGRLAHGEASIKARLHDDWRIRRAGKLIFAEAVRLEDAGAELDRPAFGAGARATATLLWVAPQAAGRLDDLRALLEDQMGQEGALLEAGASALDGFLIARLLSPAPHRLRGALIAAMEFLRGRESPRVWRS
jgi:urease accessory protein